MFPPRTPFCLVGELQVPPHPLKHGASSPRELHDPSRAARHVRDGRLDALARLGRRDGGARARRQRLRRGGRDRIHAPGRRAAPERARRRGACVAVAGLPRRADRALRPGRRSRRRHDSSATASSGTSSIPGTGVLAACVPGAFGGWLLLLEQFGTWRLEDVLAFAIGYAEDGFPFVAGIRATIERTEELLRTWPGSASSICRRPRSARSSATRRSPRRTSGSSTRPAVALARRRSRRPGARTTRASSPRRSTASSPPRAAS